MSYHEIVRLSDAYLALLKLPPGSLSRFRTDAARAQIRDMLAELRGVEPELVQTQFEQAAALTL